MSNIIPVSKGQIVALEIAHSSTGIIGSGQGTRRYTTWELAEVTKSSRKGLVLEVVRCGGSKQKIGGAIVRSIADPMQYFARKVYEAHSLASWNSAEDMKASIRAVMV